MSMTKYCNTCKYEMYHEDYPPCNYCIACDKWKPKEKEQ